MPGRLKAAVAPVGWHLLASALVILLLAAVVFGVWFPQPYAAISAGKKLFSLFAVVTLVCGPLLTLVFFDARKTRREMRFDLSVVLAIQFTAMAFAFWTVAMARPVHLVFEVDRFQVVTAAEVNAEDLPKAPQGLQKLPWNGPSLISVRAITDKDELMESIALSMDGLEPSARPGWWQNYAVSLPLVLERAKPLQVLQDTSPSNTLLIANAVQQTGLSAHDLLWLPLTGARTKEWIVLLDKTSGQPLAYAAIDGFITLN